MKLFCGVFDLRRMRRVLVVRSFREIGLGDADKALVLLVNQPTLISRALRCYFRISKIYRTHFTSTSITSAVSKVDIKRIEIT